MHKQIPSIPDDKCQQIMDKVAEFPKPARAFPRLKNTQNEHPISRITEQATLTLKTPGSGYRKAILAIAAIF
jgi:hypothetical protein